MNGGRQPLQLCNAQDVDTWRPNVPHRREPITPATDTYGDAVQRNDHRHRPEAQIRCNRVDPLACTEGGIARLQHQDAEAQQNFQCVSWWDGIRHSVPFGS